MPENVTNITVNCSIYAPEVWIANLPINSSDDGLWTPPSDESVNPILESLSTDEDKQQNRFRYRAKAAAFSQYSQNLLFTCKSSDEQLVCTIYFNYESQERESLNPNFRSEPIIVLQSEVRGETDEALRIKPPEIVDGITWKLDSYQQRYLTPLAVPSDDPGSFPFAVAASAFNEKPTLSIRFQAVGSQNGIYECVLDFVDGMSIMLDAGQKEPGEQQPWPFTDKDITSTVEQRNAYGYLVQQLGYDPKDAIQELTTDLGTLAARIGFMPPPPATVADVESWRVVCGKTIQMLEAAGRVRRMFELTDKFVTELRVENLDKVERCLQLLETDPESETTTDLSNVLGTAFGVLSVLDWEGAVAVNIASTLISFMVSQFLIPNPPPDQVKNKAKELSKTYADYFKCALQNSAVQLATVFKSWEAIQLGNSMILSGSLAWPVAKMSQLNKLANESFELRIWQALLPLKYYVQMDEDGWARIDGWINDIKPPYGDGDRFWLGDTIDGSIHTKICRHLFSTDQDEFGIGLGISFRDLMEKNNGWSIKIQRRPGRSRGPLVLEQW